eukprot:14430847-Alexandrium_andersonii.AAC.1
MSASLVGSEMCIRDRAAGLGPACPRSLGLAKTQVRALVVLWALARTCPVSYTHLTLPTICSV